MKIKFNYLFALLAFTATSFTACDDDNNDPEPEPAVLEVQTAEDIPANIDAEQGAPPIYTFYNLSDNGTVESADSASNEWDIALAGTTILVNGGISGPGQGAAQIVDGIFEDLTEAPADGYAQDSADGLAIADWYNYTGQTGTPAHAILPVPGKIIVLKTATGNYAKLEIISYYEGNPDTSTAEFADLATRPESRYYTFRYLLQQDGSRNFE